MTTNAPRKIPKHLEGKGPKIPLPPPPPPKRPIEIVIKYSK